MFAKVFAQIFDSSISEDYHTRLVFEDMLKLSDAAGVVDMTHEAIARRTNVPLEIVQKAITALEQPDPRSRNPEQEGRRIVRLDEHRDWGWQIVNYEHYRNVRDDTERRRQNREAQSRFRRKHTSASVSTSKQRKPRSAQVEEEVEVLIYNAYPRRIGRPRALAAITKALTKLDSDDLLQRVQSYARAVAGTEAQFIPYPQKWFNEERYNDDPATWKRPNGTNPKSGGASRTTNRNAGTANESGVSDYGGVGK